MNYFSYYVVYWTQVPAPPEGHSWKEVRHDNTVSTTCTSISSSTDDFYQVTWIAGWIENVQLQNKYVMFNAESRMKVCMNVLFYLSTLHAHRVEMT